MEAKYKGVHLFARHLRDCLGLAPLPEDKVRQPTDEQRFATDTHVWKDIKLQA